MPHTHQPGACGPNHCWIWPLPWLMPKHGCSCHLLMLWPWLMPEPCHPWLMPSHLQMQTHGSSHHDQLHSKGRCIVVRWMVGGQRGQKSASIKGFHMCNCGEPSVGCTTGWCIAKATQ